MNHLAFWLEYWRASEAALLRLHASTVVHELWQYSPLTVLLEHDRLNGTEYVGSLKVWLATMGDIGRAAKALDIHANTLRYRLGRIQELTGLDLERHQVRLILGLQLSLAGDGSPP